MRYWDGSPQYVGSHGYYWSGTTYGAGDGSVLWFHSSTVSPESYADPGYGQAVRCVRRELVTCFYI